MENKTLLDRKVALPKLIGDTNRFLIISGLAGPAKDIGYLTQESPNTFLFGGAMGGAMPTALGLAVSRPNERVLCVTGDGDLLMSMGSLATIASVKPKNLIIICIDNGLYQETGGQKSHTGLGVNLSKVAEGCGIPNVLSIVNEQELNKGSLLIDNNLDGPIFILLKVSEKKPPQYSRNWNASEEKVKFRKNLLK
jgi:thiamine pyrophosphate-dependent acetolactate synthase large subunit-like protein|tara:strand:- start:3284 stop:3868 length:585 start_codon:yes stop_codon:yes gene_type:complete